MKPRVIWLCSWYPNELDRFTGDFIQRHAVAAAQVAHIEVVHVVHGGHEKKTVVTEVSDSLRETIIYTGVNNKWLRYVWMLKAYGNFFNGYQAAHGKPDVVHVHVAFPAGLVGALWQARWHIPMVLTEHYGIYNHTVADRFAKRSLLFRKASQHSIQAAQLVLPVSDALAQGMMACVGSFPYRVVPNVVDTELFYYQPAPINNTFRFIHVSNMAPVKNVGGLLDAFALVAARQPQAQLHLVGAEPKEYLQQAEHLGLLHQSVFFYPECSYSEVAEKVRTAHCGVLFSHSEMLPCALLEWLCAGLPVIASRVGGIPEVIHNNNGMLVDAGNIHMLSEAMLQIIEKYWQYHRETIAVNASAQFSYAAVAQQLSTCYQAVLTKKVAP